MKKIIFILALTIFVNLATARWQQTNGPYRKVSTSCFTIFGTAFFAGSNGDGVFNGVDRIAVNKALSTRYIQSLVASAVNLFAGTGVGVFLSMSNGITHGKNIFLFIASYKIFKCTGGLNRKA